MRSPAPWLTALMAVAAVAPASRLWAQVMEIEPDGSVVTYNGPTQYLSTGARSLIPPPRAASGPGPSATGPSAATAQAIHNASTRHQVSEALVAAVAWRESSFNPAAISPKGARGVMQLMPETARRLGVNADDPIANIDGGAEYLARMLRRFDGDMTRALAAYNAGPEAVDRYRGVPPYAETLAYVRAVLARVNRPDAAYPEIVRRSSASPELP